MASNGEVLPEGGGFKVRGAVVGAAVAAWRGFGRCLRTEPPGCHANALLPDCLHATAPQAVLHAGEQQHTVAPLPSAEAAALVLDALEGE